MNGFGSFPEYFNVSSVVLFIFNTFYFPAYPADFMLFPRLLVPIPVLALLPEKFPGKAELLIDVEIHLKVLSGSLFIGKKLLADKIHAPQKLSQLFLDIFRVRL